MPSLINVKHVFLHDTNVFSPSSSLCQQRWMYSTIQSPLSSPSPLHCRSPLQGPLKLMGGKWQAQTGLPSRACHLPPTSSEPLITPSLGHQERCWKDPAHRMRGRRSLLKVTNTTLAHCLSPERNQKRIRAILSPMWWSPSQTEEGTVRTFCLFWSLFRLTDQCAGCGDDFKNKSTFFSPTSNQVEFKFLWVVFSFSQHQEPLWESTSSWRWAEPGALLNQHAWFWYVCVCVWSDHLFELAVEVTFSQDLDESWDHVARSLLLSVKSLVTPTPAVKRGMPGQFCFYTQATFSAIADLKLFAFQVRLSQNQICPFLFSLTGLNKALFVAHLVNVCSITRLLRHKVKSQLKSSSFMQIGYYSFWTVLITRWTD